MIKVLKDLIASYQYFLFDFDGLLINSEPLHFKAYKQAFERYDVLLANNFEEFIKLAHADPFWLKTLEKKHKHIYGKIEEIREYKHTLFNTLIESNTIELMPGVKELLIELSDKSMPACVVTNSMRAHVNIMKRPHEILNTIENWLCREDYEKPKPAADGYLKAKEFHPNKKAIGFEDTLKGIEALNNAQVRPVLVSNYLSTNIPGHIHLKSFCQ